LTAALPVSWVEEKFNSGEQNFFTFKETIFKQINEYGTSNKKVYRFLLQKTKILPIKLNGVIFFYN